MSASGQDGRPLIVLLEEEAHERLALVQHLTGAGFSVLEAETSDQAVSLLKRTADVKGFVSDAHVPGRIDGFALVDRVRHERPDLAVVLMSGHSDDTSGPVPEGVEFINKPNVLEYLAATLHRMIP
jgi:DNA-binding NtrC family response regulator